MHVDNISQVFDLWCTERIDDIYLDDASFCVPLTMNLKISRQDYFLP